VPWLLYSVFFSAFTIFMFLAGERHWDAFWAYLVSLFGLTPIIGSLVAVFMAKTVHNWGWLEASFNLLGWMVPMAIAGKTASRSQNGRGEVA
jgi:hypothetical protein